MTFSASRDFAVGARRAPGPVPLLSFKSNASLSSERR